MSVPIGLMLREWGGRLRKGRPAGEALPSMPPRPEGLLIWLHASREADRGVIADLAEALIDRHPDSHVLLTSRSAHWADPPDQCLHVPLPPDSLGAARAFLDHWRPDVSAWAGGRLFPAIMHELAARGTELILFDAGAAIRAARRRIVVPGLRRKTLRLFGAILCADESTARALAAAGARRSSPHVGGVLEPARTAPGCHQAEWDEMRAMLSTRPIWLAADIGSDELEAVLIAHAHMLQRMHRLLLILVPETPDDADAIADALKRRRFTFGRRSEGEEPDNQTEVYLADTEGEMGLWYRLAPVSFIGHTLARREGRKCANPFDAAALGSAVVHGPLIAPHELAFNRLDRAQAAAAIGHPGELGPTLERLIQPDRAARMATAAWHVCSAGAGAMELAVNMIEAALARAGHGADAGEAATGAGR